MAELDEIWHGKSDFIKTRMYTCHALDTGLGHYYAHTVSFRTPVYFFIIFCNLIHPRYWLSVGARPSRPVAILLGLVSL